MEERTGSSLAFYYRNLGMEHWYAPIVTCITTVRYTLSKRIVSWLRGERERKRVKRGRRKVSWNIETRPRHFSLASFFHVVPAIFLPTVILSSPIFPFSRRFNQLPDAERISRAIASKTRPVSTDMRSSSYRRLSFVAFLLLSSPTINIFLAERYKLCSNFVERKCRGDTRGDLEGRRVGVKNFLLYVPGEA